MENRPHAKDCIIAFAYNDYAGSVESSLNGKPKSAEMLKCRVGAMSAELAPTSYYHPLSSQGPTDGKKKKEDSRLWFYAQHYGNLSTFLGAACRALELKQIKIVK